MLQVVLDVCFLEELLNYEREILSKCHQSVGNMHPNPDFATTKYLKCMPARVWSPTTPRKWTMHTERGSMTERSMSCGGLACSTSTVKCVLEKTGTFLPAITIVPNAIGSLQKILERVWACVKMNSTWTWTSDSLSHKCQYKLIAVVSNTIHCKPVGAR
jgi:hypothetical protein